MGRIASILSFVKVVRNTANIIDVKADPGGGANITAENFSAPGDDSHPLIGDYVSLMPGSGAGRELAVGYLDPLNEAKADVGDKRIYARGPDGVSIVDVWLKNTGEATVSNSSASFTMSPTGSIKGENSAGSFELSVGGDFLVNGVIIDTLGNITSPTTITAGTIIGTTSVTAAGKEIANHVHPAGTPPGNTGVNT